MDAMESPPVASRPQRFAWFVFARTGVLLFCLSTLIQHSCVSSYLISGNSMNPSFEDGDRVVVANRLPLSGGPERGETIICRVGGEILIKRVMGLPGELISIDHGHLVARGHELPDPVPDNFRVMADMTPVLLGEDEYFVMGDHRRVSIDSREFGPVSEEDILGRVIFRVPRTTRAVGLGEK